jgi:hypothetical protein
MSTDKGTYCKNLWSARIGSETYGLETRRSGGLVVV